MTVEFHLPTRIARWIQPQPWLHVRSSDKALLKLGNRIVRLRVVDVPASLPVEHIDSILRVVSHREEEEEPHDIPVIASPFLSQTVRQWLAERNASYLDSRGHCHLVATGVLVHLDEPPPPPVKKREKGGVGVHGIRALQVLLEQQEPISVSQLAHLSSVSLGQAHKILEQLEQLGLVRAFGKGPAKRRVVRERTELLDWLEQQPSATRWEPSLDVALYARRPEELWSRMSTKLTQVGIPHALTGAAATSLYGVGPTNVPISLVRISPEIRLEQAAKELGAEITDRGANLALLHDTGKVGCWRTETKNGIQLAPAIRIYLDARSERRGDDIARQFREVVLGY
ncbi:helix-turn-helix domain-containing protein [Archangium violaceum]|uniref:HTH iclR-type domain-containing protein n=1 Tax=Archangium violaceum Cb vi76 TaxID=1406225 RepID=A0A084STA0_9BACT|nr:helix-turn-helix domain-containing protein [Archangium violaceum]KFA91685.1 hypothetical protein Q664_20315 [Archangium violaceum Cb vi76]